MMMIELNRIYFGYIAFAIEFLGFYLLYFLYLFFVFSLVNCRCRSFKGTLRYSVVAVA